MPERLLRGPALAFGIIGRLLSRYSFQLSDVVLRDRNVSRVGQRLRRRTETVGECSKIFGIHHVAHSCEALMRDRQQRLESVFRSENRDLPHLHRFLMADATHQGSMTRGRWRSPHGRHELRPLGAIVEILGSKIKILGSKISGLRSNSL